MAQQESEPLPIVCQLERYKVTPWIMQDRVPDAPVNTASEWFSKRWARQAEEFGCPFLEARYTDSNEEKHVNPIALNEIFFAGILAGDANLGHKVVFYTPDETFYFRDPREGGLFRPTTEEKLKTLLSLYMLQCAEELRDATPKLNLFVRFRKEDQLHKIVTKSKSLLAVDNSFFAPDSPNIRTGEPAEKEKAAKTFVTMVIEFDPQKSLTVTDSYNAFREFCVKNGFVLVERRLFEELVGEMIEQKYGLGLRNDLLNDSGCHQRGWRGLGMREDQLIQLGSEKN